MSRAIVGPYWASWILMDFGGRVTEFWGKCRKVSEEWNC